MDVGRIYLISGVPGSGKTSVAGALMRRFALGLHIPVDDLREWVVSGIAQPVPVWTGETTRQFRLAREAAAYTARLYAEAGFAVAVDDVIFPSEAQAIFVESLRPHTIARVLLRPSLEVALARNAARTNKEFDTSLLAETCRTIYRSMDEREFAAAGWIVVDSSALSVEETVDEILKRAV